MQEDIYRLYGALTSFTSPFRPLPCPSALSKARQPSLRCPFGGVTAIDRLKVKETSQRLPALPPPPPPPPPLPPPLPLPPPPPPLLIALPKENYEAVI